MSFFLGGLTILIGFLFIFLLSTRATHRPALLFLLLFLVIVMTLAIGKSEIVAFDWLTS